jgi:alkylhydroperoxidase family enzyme
MNTLANQLSSSSVDFSRLHQQYSPLLGLVNALIGVIPNCDPILEIWPVGFRTYNLLVPNLLNLPVSLIGRKSNKALQGLAMYTASKTAQCAYCTAHTCSFALRRGLDYKVFSGNTNPKEKAVIALAEALSVIRSNVPSEVIPNLRIYFSDTEMEWLALSIGLMGFLNKFMDAVGVELEVESMNGVSHILKPDGWSPGKHSTANSLLSVSPKSVTKDSLKIYLSVFLKAPGAIRIEQQWTKDVPNNQQKAEAYLQETVGYTWTLVRNIGKKRVVRALTTILRDNLDVQNSIIGLSTKALCGLIFATVVENDYLSHESVILAKLFNSDLEETTIDIVRNIAYSPVPSEASECKKQLTEIIKASKLSEKEAAAFIFSRAISSSPADVNDAILSEISPLLSHQELVELNVWISIQQLMHRLEKYYSAVSASNSP